MVFVAMLVNGALGHLIVSQVDVARVIAEQSNSPLVIVTRENESVFRDFEQSSRSTSELVGGGATGSLRLNRQDAEDEFADSMARFHRDIYGGRLKDHRDALQQRIDSQGSEGFRVLDVDDSLHDPENIPVAYWYFVGCIFLWWMLMLVCQGEGLDMDLSRRRHPHWEWLLSHPVKPVLAFFAEFLAPMMVNPIYLTAPAFWFMILKSVYPLFTAFCAAFLIGICFAIAASSLNKSIEIAATLRLPVSKRGAVLGLTSLLGYMGMFLTFFLVRDNAITSVIIRFCASLPDMQLLQWIPRALLLGWSSAPVLWQSVFAALLVPTVFILAAGLLTWWGTKNGLQASEPSVVVNSTSSHLHKPRWIRNAYFRKEMLWLRRDKSAVLQIILIPFMAVGLQFLNLQAVLQNVGLHWNVVCGLAIIFGSYFLLVIGPRSLSSEGGALWIAQTWPTSLENLLKAKAKLWFGVALCIVYIILLGALIAFPEHWWRILLVAMAWPVFSWGLSHKAICLITAPSSSGEPEKPPMGRQWAVLLGTFSFGAGVLTQSWHLAVVGIVFSLLTAAAMWQNLRVRLPFLFDQWSEPLPAPPTLMQIMIGIAIMVECVSIGTALAASFGSAEQLWLFRAIGYAVVGAIAYLVMQSFLSQRGVTARQIWIWQADKKQHIVWFFIAIISGIVLSGIAWVYLEALRALPMTRDYMTELDSLSAQFAGGIIWQLLLIAGLVPVVEEYFFRGLLFRALDNDLGGWTALLASSAFFAVYHPPVSWVPVFLVGLIAAVVFKLNGRLWPCVTIHMAYNFMVVMFVQ